MLSEVAFPNDGRDLDYLFSLAIPEGNRCRFVSIGTLSDVKAFHLGLYSFARAAIRGSEYWIIGDGVLRKHLESLAEKLNITERVRFFGAVARDEALRLLGECDVLVHPSLHDSGGWVCLEAMAAGRPVICLKLGGPATQVTEESGFRCTAINPSAAIIELAEAMRRLAHDHALRKSMGQAGRKRVRDHYLMEDRVQFFSECYERVILEGSAIRKT
jgi:glycosyltransferase involved in cell wall biosynthesis